ncbi:MAG: TlyA family RNA methyltransferase [Actinomycetaceae bacterium]|nr:TlyA family RNA methyltransferase [Arcanobacterium sp.]MDD7504401.1 TlyA family RNA methyltransferase [Actinomycetaceae bacterium]MDY6143589.1 TlyA family RNA methyltransferase [Arcanobacterium sp.]
MAKLRRIDAELVRRKLARSRADAAERIRQGRVKLDGQTITKPSRQVDPAQAIVVDREDRIEYASRGAYKLLGALEYLGDDAPQISGVRALDAGASTGGFTDVLLKYGASEVIAVDVGYGQLLWRLREDPRVRVLERTNIRYLEPQVIAPLPQLVVGDLSFISLTLVIPALVACSTPDAKFLLMVKPQFEIGKGRLGEGGVVRDPRDHIETVLKVAHNAQENMLQINAVAPSPLPGPKGNVEYFLYMEKVENSHRDDENRSEQRIVDMITEAVHNGPAAQQFSGTQAIRESAENNDE